MASFTVQQNVFKYYSTNNQLMHCGLGSVYILDAHTNLKNYNACTEFQMPLFVATRISTNCIDCIPMHMNIWEHGDI